jgi:hypothetical protein
MARLATGQDPAAEPRAERRPRMPTYKHPCPRCGNFIQHDVPVCPFCGTTDPFIPGRCATCGRSVDDPRWAVCPGCGSSLRPVDAAPATVVPTRSPLAAPPRSIPVQPLPPAPAPSPSRQPTNPAPSGGQPTGNVPPAGPARSQNAFCTGCGAPLGPGARFCTTCGTLAE